MTNDEIPQAPVSDDQNPLPKKLMRNSFWFSTGARLSSAAAGEKVRCVRFNPGTTRRGNCCCLGPVLPARRSRVLRLRTALRTAALRGRFLANFLRAVRVAAHVGCYRILAGPSPFFRYSSFWFVLSFVIRHSE